MQGVSNPGGRDRRTRQRGVAMLVVLVALVGLLAFASLGVDVGLVWAARTQLQNATDAAALAGVASLIQVDPLAVTEPLARERAMDLASRHRAVHANSLALREGDLEIGSWDLSERQFTPLPGADDPFRVNAMRVTARLDEASGNGPVPAFLSRVVGRESFDVGAQAVAYVGFAGSAPQGIVAIPIAVHCCRLEGASCEDDYCTTIETSPPNECQLGELETLSADSAGDLQEVDDPTHVDYAPASCIKFDPDGGQTACWTNFRETAPPHPNADVLIDLVQNGNSVEVQVGNPILLDNGDKTPVIRSIADRFRAEGSDRYPPFDLQKDSWVVKLPVVACPGGENACEHSSEVTGFVCFEVRQVEVTSAKEIRGRFLCPDADFVVAYDLFEDCEIGGSSPGGDPEFGLRAVPVLVR